jgi:2-dehydropantoate 2-reductase
MKVCIVGAGAIGGLLGARLAAAGQADVAVLARGATLHALQSRGWRLSSPLGDVQRPALAFADVPALLRHVGTPDVLVLAVKATALPSLATSLAPLMGAQTRLLPAMNGVPWWFMPGEPLHSVDPGGAVARALPPAQVMGAVVHLSSSQPEPGRVVHTMGRGLIVGEPAGGPPSAATQAAAAVLGHAGFEVSTSSHIRQDLWFKLWGNLTMNPVSALTGATIDQVLADPLVRALCSGAMQEAAAIGWHIGCPIETSPEERHAVTAKLGAFKTSMLQDALAGRAIELDAIVGAVHELGTRCGVPLPHIGALFGLTRLWARGRGLYPPAW